MSWHQRAADGSLLLKIHVQPGAKRTEVAGLHGDALKVRVAAAAVEDRANDALVAFIAQRLGVAKRDVAIAAGTRSRDKRVEVRAPADPARLFA
ncbi:MAG TPA: DUF167 domain-containing protein [Usitatibacter sp.]|nr:DUF167 domain-containing protein [Usitatibacter sp.]